MAHKRKTTRPYVRRKVGDRFGSVVAVEYLGMLPGGNAYWLCRCDCGTDMRVQPGQFATVKSCGKGQCHPKYKDEPSYQRVHTRLAGTRGPARDAGPCVDCAGPANEWSYDKSDPDALMHPDGHPYSTDLSRYVPRCTSCHRAFDKQDSETGGALATPRRKA